MKSLLKFIFVTDAIGLALAVCVGGVIYSCNADRNVVGTRPYEPPPVWDGSRAIRHAMCALGHTEFCSDGPLPVAAPDFEGSVSWDDLDAEDKGVLGPYWLCADPRAEIKYTCRWVHDDWQCTIDWGSCAGSVTGQ